MSSGSTMRPSGIFRARCAFCSAEGICAAAERGRGRPGADRVDPDLVGRQLVGGVAGEAEEPGFGRAVIGAAAERDAPPGDRGDVDDRAATARFHVRDAPLGCR